MMFARCLALSAHGVELLDRLLEGLSLDEAHGIEGTAVCVLADGVDRHNIRVLQPAGNLRFAEKTAATLRIAGVPRAQTFERDFAVQLFIPRQMNFAQTTLGMKAQDLIMRPGGQRGLRGRSSRTRWLGLV